MTLFARDAMYVLDAAVAQARASESATVRAVDLLVAVVAVPGPASRVLTIFGLGYDTVRRHLPPPELPLRSGGQPLMSSAARSMVDMAYREAFRRERPAVRAAHLAFSVIVSADITVERVLWNSGLESADRKALERSFAL